MNRKGDVNSDTENCTSPHMPRPLTYTCHRWLSSPGGDHLHRLRMQQIRRLKKLATLPRLQSVVNEQLQLSGGIVSWLAVRSMLYNIIICPLSV